MRTTWIPRGRQERMKERIARAIQDALDGILPAGELKQALAGIVGPDLESLDDLVGTHDIYPYEELIVTRKAAAQQIRGFLEGTISLAAVRDWTEIITMIAPGFEDAYEEIILEAVYTIDNYEDLKGCENELWALLSMVEGLESL